METRRKPSKSTAPHHARRQRVYRFHFIPTKTPRLLPPRSSTSKPCTAITTRLHFLFSPLISSPSLSPPSPLMATEVLRPHNILVPPQRIRATRQKPNPGATRKPPPLASTASRRHHGRPSSSSTKKTAVAPARPAVEVYAGPAFSVSPEPSSLPLPQFQFKKATTVAVVDDTATRDLRRILRLE